jgi:putative transposase
VGSPAAHYAAIDAKCHELKCEMMAIGGGEDHVHLLVRIPTTLAVSALLKEIKGASSHLITHEVIPNEFFKWQGAYGAFTVSKHEVKAVAAYICNQKKHHTARDLMDDWERCESEEEGAGE